MKKQIWVLTCLAAWMFLAACTTKQPPLTPYQEATLDKLIKLSELEAQVEQMANEQQNAVLAGDTARARLLKRLRDELVEILGTEAVIIGEFGKSADPLGLFPEAKTSGTARVPPRRPGETVRQYLTRTENPSTYYNNWSGGTPGDKRSASYDASQKSISEIATDTSLSLWKKPFMMVWRFYKGPPKKKSLNEIITDKSLSLGEKHRLMARKIEEIQADATRRHHEQPEPDE